MHLKRGENPLQSSKRSEGDRRQRDFDKVFDGTFCYLLRSRTWGSHLLLGVLFNQSVCLFVCLFLQKSESNGNAFRSFCGCQYTGVETIGKELFLYFGSRALR